MDENVTPPSGESKPPAADRPGVGEAAAPQAPPLELEIEEAVVIDEEPAPLRTTDIPFPPADQGPPPLTYLELYEARRRRTYLLGGVAVSSLGLALFVVIVTGISFWGTLFLIPGVLLVVLALAWKPYYWLYLPGLAVLGFGLGWIVDDAIEPSPDIWLSWIGLGAGLLLGYALRRAQGRRPHWLPLVGGALAVAVGWLAGVDDRWQIVWKGWPLIIVAVGLSLIARALLMGRRKRGERSGPPAVR